MSSLSLSASPTAATAAKHPLWFYGLLALLAVIPLPFGSNRPWAGDLMGLCAGLLLALCARDLYRRPALWPAGAPWRRIAFSAAAFMAVVAWGYLQTTGWFPPPHPLWAQAAATLGQPIHGAASLTPDLYQECALRLLAYAACFLLAFFGAREPARALLLLRTVAGIAVAYAVYGLLIQSSGLDIVLWYKKWAYQGYLTSTFINKNSYADYAGMGLLCCLGLMWEHIKNRPSLRRSIMALERIGARDLYLMAMCLSVFGALLLTSSRAGITSTIAGCFALIAALAVNRKWQGRQWLAILLPGGVFLLGFASFSAETFFDSIDPQTLENSGMLRINAYQTIFRALDDNPWQGFGLGSFTSAFRLYRDAEIHEWFEHAHDDYLELSMELGVPMTALLLAGIASIVSCSVQGVMNRRKHEVFCIVAVGASVLVALHSLVDFSMEIPACAATYAAILGLGAAQSWSSKRVAAD